MAVAGSADMQIILTKEEYDDLVKKASATELLAEEKAEAYKAQIKEQILEICKRAQSHGFPVPASELMRQLAERLEQF